MVMLTDLADACRKSGLEVVEIDGWRTRGHGGLTAVESIACHHTATPLSAGGDYPSLRIVRDGRSDLPGPLAQIGLGRNGVVYVIAAGVAYHAGGTFYGWQDNWHAIGIEAEHDGISPWPSTLYAAYVRLCAALTEHYGLPTARVVGHKEIAAPLGRKVDPNFDMPAFRRAVDDARDNQEDDMFSDEDRATLQRIEKMTRTKLTRVNTRLARANDMLRDLRKRKTITPADLDAAVAELEAALDDEEEA